MSFNRKILVSQCIIALNDLKQIRSLTTNEQMELVTLSDEYDQIFLAEKNEKDMQFVKFLEDRHSRSK